MRASSSTTSSRSLQERDERQEQRAVEPVLVEVVGRDVRGRDHHDARGEEGREQPAQDHRVGDVAHRKLVEAKERSLARQIRRNRRDRVLAGDLAALPRLAPLIEAGVDVGHEGVKMRPPLGRPLDGVEEHVHQHRLAAADRPMDVKAARRLGRLRAEQAREAARLCLGLVVLQFAGERVELADKLRLRGVGLEAALGDERAIAVGDGGHASAPSPSGEAAAKASPKGAAGVAGRTRDFAAQALTPSSSPRGRDGRLSAPRR